MGVVPDDAVTFQTNPVSAVVGSAVAWLLRALWRYYYQGVNGLVFVIDSNDTERVMLAADELQHLLSQDDLRNAAVLVLANKQDLPHAMAVTAIGSKLGLDKARDRKWRVHPCCAATGEGLYEGFDWLAENLPKA